MYKSKKIIAIIPARSGSKGLIDKNIKDLNGKPLIFYTIEAAKESNVFDYIMVSTDSEKYAEISRKYGAEVPFLRSESNSNDNSGSWDVVKEVLDNLQEKYDIIVLLQPTSPLRTSKNIKEAVDLFFDKNADSIVSVSKFSHPIAFVNTLNESLSLKGFIKEEYQNMRRQDFEQNYMLNGAIYIVKTEFVNKNLDLFRKNSFAYIMEEEHSVDIDQELDFAFAETLMKKRSY